MFRRLNEYAVSAHYIPTDLELVAEFQGPGYRVTAYSTQDLLQNYPELELLTEHHPATTWLLIQIVTPVEPFDSAHESARYSRPRLMILLSCISYLCDCPILPNQAVSGGAKLTVDLSIMDSEPCVKSFDIAGMDNSSELSTLLESQSEESNKNSDYVASALDRFRRGLYLEGCSVGESLFEEEAYMSYFHTLELISRQFSDEQKKSALSEIRTLFSTTLSGILHPSHRKSDQQDKSRWKKFESVLTDEGDFSTSSVMKYYLDKCGLLEPTAAELIDDLVKIRNSIAHGNNVYRSDLIWPIPQFFPLHPDTLEHLWAMKVCAARGISAYLGSQSWDKEWRELVACRPASINRVKDFINESQFEQISHVEFVNGRIDGITPSLVAFCYVSRSLSDGQLVHCLAPILTSDEVPDEWMDELLIAALILSDSGERKVAQSSQYLIRRWKEPRELKDEYRYLQFRGFDIIWLRDFLRST